jgi:hypothetical protein
MIDRLHDINRVLELKDKLTNSPRLQVFLGQQLTGSSFRNFIKEFNRLLPGKTREQVVRESFLHLAGVVLTQDLLEENAWRMAGNIGRLLAWRPVVPWSRQADHEYVPVQIVAGRRAVLGGKHAVEFDFQVLAGTPTGMIITKIWSNRLCAALSRQLGFSNARGGFPFDDAMQLVNLRMYVMIDPAKSARAPDFEEVWQESNGKTIRPLSMYNHNRKLLRMRVGRGWPCPKNFDRELHPCHLCHIGQEECLTAVHDLTYVSKFCAGCEKDSWFDPASSRQICVNCHNKNIGRQT